MMSGEKLIVLNRIRAVRDVLEKGVPSQEEKRYSLGDPSGGGYSSRFTLNEAVDEALWLTSDEAQKHNCLYLENHIGQTIALFCDGRAFVPAEFNQAGDGGNDSENVGMPEEEVEEIHQCETEGCTSTDTMDCYLPGDYDTPHGYYCHEHVFDAGFCRGCGTFWGGVESFEFGNGYCDNCRSEFEQDEECEEDYDDFDY